MLKNTDTKLTTEKFQSRVVSFIQVLSENEELKRWYLNLYSMPASRRSKEIGDLTARMGNYKSLRFVIQSLNDKRFYDAMLKTLKEMENSKGICGQG